MVFNCVSIYQWFFACSCELHSNVLVLFHRTDWGSFSSLVPVIVHKKSVVISSKCVPSATGTKTKSFILKNTIKHKMGNLH